MSPHSRRGFLRKTLGAVWTSSALLDQAFFRATAARAQSHEPGLPKLFDIEKAADGVYLALAHPVALINSNAAIFENANDLLIVDTHSKPSAAAALVAQIRKEITQKPVRYVVNSHFHWDHTQGNAAYRRLTPHADIIATEATRQLLADEGAKRIKASVEESGKSLNTYKEGLGKATTAEEKRYYGQMVSDTEAYLREMKDYAPDLPNVTVGRDLIIRDKAHTLHLAFRGRAHTAGDIVVWCPEKKAIATGDMLHGWAPYIGDGYPREWPNTLIGLTEMDFDHILGGHSPIQKRQKLYQMRDYLEELTVLVAAGKRAGKSVEQVQKEVTPDKLKTLAGGYGADMAASQHKGFVTAPSQADPEILADSIRSNVADTYKRVDT
jgi:cyclase